MSNLATIWGAALADAMSRIFDVAHFFKTVEGERLVAVSAAGILLLAALEIGRREVFYLSGLDPSEFAERVSGPKNLKHCDTMINRRDRLERFKNRKLVISLLNLVLLAVCGFAVPSALLFVGCMYHNWIMPGHQIFQAIGNPAVELANPGMGEIAKFVGTQFLGGTLLDAMEV